MKKLTLMEFLRPQSPYRGIRFLVVGLAIAGVSGCAMQRATYTASDVLEIENLEGRYLHYMDSDRMDLVADLFAKEDAEISIDIPSGKGTGIEAVTREFAKLKGMVDTQGGFMGTHLAASPVVVIDSNGRTARGSWMSIGFTVLGPAFALPGQPTPTPPYNAFVTVGRYEHSFEKRNGVWKIKNFKWSIFVSLPTIHVDPAKDGRGWANTPLVPGAHPEPWPLPPTAQ